MKRWLRLSRRDWYARGGLTNRKLFRKQHGGAWSYWELS